MVWVVCPVTTVGAWEALQGAHIFPHEHSIAAQIWFKKAAVHGGGARENPPGGANSLDFAEPCSEEAGGSNFKSLKVQFLAHFKGKVWGRFWEMFEFTVKWHVAYILKKKKNQHFRHIDV